MKTLLKRILYYVAPRLATEFFSARSRAHSHRIVGNWGAERLNRTLVDHYGRKVLSGPFLGLVLGKEAEKEMFGPYLLGTYESELHPWIERIANSDFETCVDVGAKFGYYSVGLARRCPKIRSIAFDTDPWARKAIRETAAANKVENVDIRSYCDKAWLVKSLPPKSFVLSDCEGFEAELFGEMSGSLMTATILVETHELESGSTSQVIREVFTDSHLIEEVESGSRRESPVDLSFFSQAEQQMVLHEVRQEQSWLLLTPKSVG